MLSPLVMPALLASKAITAAMTPEPGSTSASQRTEAHRSQLVAEPPSEVVPAGHGVHVGSGSAAPPTP